MPQRTIGGDSQGVGILAGGQKKDLAIFGESNGLGEDRGGEEQEDRHVAHNVFQYSGVWQQAARDEPGA